jgi:hydroxymethylpyrimidine pyrophosphatase-like HAD family hydrolase
MKPLSELTKDDVKNIKIVCFDVDGVTIKRGTQIIDKGDVQTMKTIPLGVDILEKLRELKKYYHVTINSGRSTFYLIKVFADLLWDNSSLISENGIFLLYNGSLIQNFQFTAYELGVLQRVTDRLKKLAEEDTRADGFEYKVFLLVLHCNNEIPEVEKIVFEEDTKGEFYCWWNGEAYDICPKRFNKGVGLKKLCEFLGYSVENAIAIGNGINDKEMTDIAGIGITTDKEHLQSDYYIEGEHLGGKYLIDKLLELNLEKIV